MLEIPSKLCQKKKKNRSCVNTANGKKQSAGNNAASAASLAAENNYMTPSSVEAFAPHEYFCTMNDQRHQLEGGFNNNREWNVRAYISLLNHFYYLSLK